MSRSTRPRLAQQLLLALGIAPLLSGGCEVGKLAPSPRAPARGPVAIQEGVAPDDPHPRSAIFSFTNVGTADLRIESVRASCGCTIAAAPKQIIPPGEVASIRVRGKPPQVGKISVRIVVETNLPDEPRLTLTWDLVDTSPPPRLLDTVGGVNFGIHILGNRIEPQSVQFEVLEVATSTPVVATARGAGPFRLNGGFAGQRNVDEPGLVARSYRWSVMAEDRDVAGTVAGEVQVMRANDEAKPWFTIPISLTRVEPVRVVPDRLILANSSGVGPCSFRVLVTSKFDDQSLIVTCESHDPNVAVAAARTQPGRAWFDVTVNHPGEVRELQPVVFSVTQPVVRRLSVPLIIPRTK